METLFYGVTYQGQRSSEVNFHHPQTATAGDTSGPGTAMEFFYSKILFQFSTFELVYKKWSGTFPF